MIRAIAMLLATGLTFGAVQTPARDATVVAPSGTASLAGTVTDADGHPLRRATVSIGGDMRLDRRMVTDDEGRFTFGSLPAGRFTVTAVKGGYPSMSYGAQRSNRAGSGVLLAAGQQMTGIVLKLSRGGVLTGTVFDERGQPMPEVPVMAFEVRTSLAGELVLAPPSARGTPWMRRLGDISDALVSGLMRVRGVRRQRAYDRGFVLSDHADWPSLLSTIDETGASRVLATHGHAEALARYLREHDVESGVIRTAWEDEGGADDYE